ADAALRVVVVGGGVVGVVVAARELGGPPRARRAQLGVRGRRRRGAVGRARGAVVVALVGRAGAAALAHVLAEREEANADAVARELREARVERRLDAGDEDRVLANAALRPGAVLLAVAVR